VPLSAFTANLVFAGAAVWEWPPPPSSIGLSGGREPISTRIAKAGCSRRHRGGLPRPLVVGYFELDRP
jgi:hypothetical protein